MSNYKERAVPRITEEQVAELRRPETSAKKTYHEVDVTQQRILDCMPLTELTQLKENVIQELEVRDKRQAADMQKAQDALNISQGIQGTTSLHKSASGATSSHIPLRYDLIPRQLLEIAAKRYSMGVEIHGERGYQRGLCDRDFIINRINHIAEHWNKLFHPDYSSDDKEESITLEAVEANLGAIIWGLGFLCEVLSTVDGKEIFGQLIDQGQVRFKEKS